MFFIIFPITSYSIVKPSQLNLLSFFVQISQYLEWLKRATHQKAKSSRVLSLSKSDNLVNDISVFSAKRVEFSKKWQVLLRFSPPLQSPLTIPSLTPANFHPPILPPYLFTKLSLQYPPTLLSSIPLYLLFLPSSILSIFTYSSFYNPQQKSSPLLQSSSQFRLSQGTNKPVSLVLHDSCFILSILPRSMDRENNIQNYWFFIAHTWKIGVSQVAASDKDTRDQIGKSSTPLSPRPSIYYIYFHTQLISSYCKTSHLENKNMHKRLR